MPTGLQVKSNAFQEFWIFPGQTDNPIASIAGQASEAQFARPLRTTVPMIMVYVHLPDVAR